MTAHSELYIQAVFLFLFALVIGVRSLFSGKSIIDPKSIIELLNNLKFVRQSLSDEELKRLDIAEIYEPDFKDKLPGEYKKALEKFELFQLKNVYTYSELFPELAKIKAEEKKEKTEMGWFERFLWDPFMNFIADSLIGLFVGLVGIFIVFADNDDVREQNKKTDWNLLVNPNERSSGFMQSIGIVCLFIMSMIIYYLIFQKFNTGFYILSGILIIHIINLAWTFYWRVNCQVKFKNKWTEIMDFIMQKATLENNHDLYNQAFNYRRSINEYPDVPISEMSRTYLFIYAIMQFLVHYGYDSKLF